MKRASGSLSTLEAACERVAARLAEEPLNRHTLLDMATALTIIAHALHLVAQVGVSRAPETEAAGVRRALDQLDDCLLTVRTRKDMPDTELRAHLVEATRHASEALRVFRQFSPS